MSSSFPQPTHQRPASAANGTRTSSYLMTRKERKQDPKAHEDIVLLGYRFSFVQAIIPECDESGHAIKYYPQNEYKGNRKLHKYGDGAFCRFSIHTDNVAGVYLLICEGELLYIGQTCNLNQRFNNSRFGSYGFITSVACYTGGQMTNCKINQLVLKYFEEKTPLQLYFLPTSRYKEIERFLLSHISTSFNEK